IAQATGATVETVARRRELDLTLALRTDQDLEKLRWDRHSSVPHLVAFARGGFGHEAVVASFAQRWKIVGSAPSSARSQASSASSPSSRPVRARQSRSRAAAAVDACV